MIDAVACEPHFVRHLAPVWRALPDAVRGRLFVYPTLVDYAGSLGVAATAIDVDGLRHSPQVPASPGPGPAAFVTSIGDTKVARRLGYRRFVFMEHGIGQSYSGRGRSPIEASYSGGPDREDVGLFLVPNQNAADRWLATYPDTPVEIIGCPKLDDLPKRGPGPAPTICVSFHWNTPTSFAALPAEAGWALGDYLPRLPELAKAFTVIGHAHPRGDHPEQMARHYRRAGIEFVRDFDEVCRRADVYVCDNSSTIYEFASTGRPVVLLNSKAYRPEVKHGLRFWEAAKVGINVNCGCDLVDLVGAALADPRDVAADREAALDIVYAYRHGAAERAAAAITRYLFTRTEDAA